MDDQPKHLIIAKLNDLLREQHIGGQVLVTVGVQTLEQTQLNQLLTEIAQADDFSDKGNDPYGEHDFGKVDFGGERYFWKIDYYDKRLTFASPDPSDPAVTQRVMTILRADEY